MKIEIISKSLYPGSGPRGVDVYARHLYDYLSRTLSSAKIKLSKDRPGTSTVNLIHFTFFDPFFLTLWGLKLRAPYIVTVHDLIPLKFPTHFPSGIRGKLKWYLQKRALSGAAAIITDSESSKSDLISLANFSAEKIHVIPLAAGHTTVNEKLVRTVKTEYHLPDKYLLYVGDINWNKNIPGLIEAFAKQSEQDLHLILVGKAFESSKVTVEYQSIQTAILNSNKSAFIHMLGFVPSHHLPAIYKAATLYVQPSWYEGFGFPVLEALEQGTPVASSSAGSLKEVGGSCAHYFDPNVEGEMEKIISELLSSRSKREKFVQPGKAWAKSFTWIKVVKATKLVYEKVLNHS